jgi:hypothetical protein
VLADHWKIVISRDLRKRIASMFARKAEEYHDGGKM